MSKVEYSDELAEKIIAEYEITKEALHQLFGTFQDLNPFYYGGLTVGWNWSKVFKDNEDYYDVLKTYYESRIKCQK